MQEMSIKWKAFLPRDIIRLRFAHMDLNAVDSEAKSNITISSPIRCFVYMIDPLNKADQVVHCFNVAAISHMLDKPENTLTSL